MNKKNNKRMQIRTYNPIDSVGSFFRIAAGL